MAHPDRNWLKTHPKNLSTDFTLFGDLIINNPTRVVKTFFFSNQQEVTTYQYQYDEDGYPVNKLIQITNDGVPGNPFNLKYEYY